MAPAKGVTKYSSEFQQRSLKTVLSEHLRSSGRSGHISISSVFRVCHKHCNLLGMVSD